MHKKPYRVTTQFRFSPGERIWRQRKSWATVAEAENDIRRFLDWADKQGVVVVAAYWGERHV